MHGQEHSNYKGAGTEAGLASSPPKEEWGSLSGTNIDTITSSKMNGKLQHHGEGNSAFISFYQENNLLSCFVQTATISCHYPPLCCNVLSEQGLFGWIKERIVSSP